MKLNKNIILVSSIAFTLGAFINNFAMSETPCNCKIGVIDVQEVLNSSSQVKDLKKSQEQTAQEIIKYIETARKDVASVEDENKKKSMEKKYVDELSAKRDKLEKEYVSKLKAIDDSISASINEYAKNNGYKLVITKGAVLYGGEDITDAIKKIVK